MIIPSLRIKNAVKAKGYEWLVGNKDYSDINLVGIRNLDKGNDVTNLFDDVMTLQFTSDGEIQFYVWPCTTDPGKKGVMEYHNPLGVARLVEGQYLKAYGIGFHQGKYEALVQIRPVKVWRDPNRDMKFDETKVDEGLFGINIHHAMTDTTYVENWSEGCQVFKTLADFDEFMAIMRKARDAGFSQFNYTLINSKDIGF